jgi:hypothetical protein
MQTFDVTELFGRRLTIDSIANFLISLIALGARFLNDMPWTCGFAKFFDQSSVQYSCFGEAMGMNHRVDFIKLDLSRTYSLVQVDCVFARDDIGDG